MKARALVAALALFVTACAQEAPAPVVDAALLAFLSKARAAHHIADIAEGANEPAKAIGSLEGLIRGPRPGGAALPPEAAEVLADTHARVADLRSKMGAFPAALADVDQGLGLAQSPTHFRGHLFEIQGVVLERQAKALEAAGDAPGAEQAKTRAVDAFETAIKIQDRVIDEALSGKDHGRAGRDGG